MNYIYYYSTVKTSSAHAPHCTSLHLTAPHAPHCTSLHHNPQSTILNPQSSILSSKFLGSSRSICTTHKEEKKKTEPTHLKRIRMISRKMEEERMIGARKESMLARRCLCRKKKQEEKRKIEDAPMRNSLKNLVGYEEKKGIIPVLKQILRANTIKVFLKFYKTLGKLQKASQPMKDPACSIYFSLDLL